MKNVFIIAFSLILMVSCGGIKTSSSGQEQEAYLEFIGNPDNYSGGVDVSVDNKTAFTAEVFNSKPARLKGKVYTISTGKHKVSVSYKNSVIYNKDLFISTQETKKILLP